MDNFNLNEDQLWQLRNFIIKRGIKEADVVNEILDHFACKVEEIMGEEKNMPFERAMQIAHKSFGSSGFRPLVAQYEKHVEHAMWQDYKTSLKETLLSPVVLLSIGSAFLFYFFINNLSVLWRTHWLFGIKFWAILFSSLGFIIAKIYFYRKIKTEFGINLLKVNLLEYWQQISLTIPGNALLAANFALIIPASTDKDPSPYLIVYFCVVILLSTISSLTQYRTFLKLNKRFGNQILCL